MRIIQTVKKTVIGLSLAATLLFPVAAFAQTPPAPTGTPTTTDAKGQVCEGVGLATGSTGCDQPAGSTSVDSVIVTVVNILSFVVGVAAVIMIIIAGLKYVMSSGDSNSVNSAKNTILYSIIGLVVAIASQVIVRFVLKKL